MKQTLLILSVSVLILSVQVGIARAVDSTAKPIRVRNEAIRDARQDFREDRNEAVKDFKDSKDKEAFRDSMEENRVERKASISGARQTFRTEKARIHGERLARHFAFYEQRLTNIITRLQTRIDKEKADGEDVSSAQASLDAGKALLVTAVADGKKAVEMFASITVSTWNTQQPEIKAAIDQAQKTRKEFAETRVKLMSVVQTVAIKK